MNRWRIITLVLFFNPLTVVAGTYSALNLSLLDSNSNEKCIHIANVYKDAIEDFDQEKNEVILKNGFKVACDDKIILDMNDPQAYLQQLNQVDISDILLQEYPFEYSAPIYEVNFSPGRLRNDQLLLNAYLALEKAPESVVEVSAKEKLTTADLKKLGPYLKSEIVKVKFLGFSINMNKRNNAAAALKLVGQRLEKEAPEAVKWLKKNRNMSGGFNMRFISGTNRLSAHSWGIAVDFTLKVATKDVKWFDSYWKWVAECLEPLSCPEARTNKGVKNRREAQEKDLEVQIFTDNFDHFNKTVVRIFSEEGFIWGGHWNHFDTMHFEYRPEFFKHNIED